MNKEKKNIFICYVEKNEKGRKFIVTLIFLKRFFNCDYVIVKLERPKWQKYRVKGIS